MLSRTAANLYWMGRYIERAENLARVLEVGYRMAQMPDWAGGGNRDEWQSLSFAVSCDESLNGDVAQKEVINRIALDDDNPSSIYHCLKTARTNARAVRTALTSEMWESLNDTWLAFDRDWRVSLSADNLLSFLDWVKVRSTLFRGAMRGTMLRDEGFAFVNVGTFIERADSTARILDVKYHILLPPGETLGGSLDYYQWATVLRAVSALGSYHWVFRDSIKPWLVAELLILREEMPRSLRHSLSQVSRYLDTIVSGLGQTRDCHRRAGQLYAQLCYDNIEDVFQGGLHEYLTNFMSRNNRLGQAIAEDFYF